MEFKPSNDKKRTVTSVDANDDDDEVPVKMEKTDTTDRFSQLPDHILVQTLSLLDCKSLVSISEVSYKLQQLTKNEQYLWKSIAYVGDSADELKKYVKKSTSFTRNLYISFGGNIHRLSNDETLFSNCDNSMIKNHCEKLRKLIIISNDRFPPRISLPDLPSSLEELSIENCRLDLPLPGTGTGNLPNLKRLKWELFHTLDYSPFIPFIIERAPALCCLDLSHSHTNHLNTCGSISGLQHLSINYGYTPNIYFRAFIESLAGDSEQLKEVRVHEASTHLNIDKCHNLLNRGVTIITDSSTVSEIVAARKLCSYCSTCSRR